MMIDSRLITFLSLHALAVAHIGDRQSEKGERNRDPNHVLHKGLRNRRPRTDWKPPGVNLAQKIHKEFVRPLSSSLSFEVRSIRLIRGRLGWAWKEIH